MTNVDRTLDFYALLLSDFPTAVSKYLADGFVWENPLPETIPFGGIYTGADGLASYFVALTTAIEMKPLHFTDLVADGPIVSAIAVEEDTLVKSTGKRYTMPCVHVVRFDASDKITHVREYNDITQMLQAFQP